MPVHKMYNVYNAYRLHSYARNSLYCILQVSLSLVVVVLADQSSHVSISLGGAPAVSHHGSSHHARPSYHHQPTYYSQPSYHPAPAYHPQPSYKHEHEPAVPACAANTTKAWCLEDADYPTYEIKHAAEYHYEKVLSLYADVAELNTELSVERPDTLEEETYLCPSETAYVRPLRAQNTEGKWRVIVNNIDAHYQTLTQTTRFECRVVERKAVQECTYKHCIYTCCTWMWINSLMKPQFLRLDLS
ncbi:uncharacterized protein LOC122244001 [Penaeus japonicus]|uniref:uncharacterized protein LOC122244001 n=1 Tax=Penaeus japonicus TaxID=27405 RepID=UPI001C710B41|nr:uncharacterized protein LOC122244001 [Penaeus japonicus]